LVWEPPLVVLAGVGMGREDITAQTEQWIARADVLVGGRRVLEWFADHPAMKIDFPATMDPALDQALDLADRKLVLVLASGDPLFYGVGRRLLKRLGSERLLVIPNISAIQALFARIPESWEDVQVFSLHGRSHNQWLQELRAGRKVAILTDPRHSPDWIARELAGAAIRDCTLVVGENLGSADEQISVLSVDEAGTMVFAPLNVVAVLPDRQAPRVPEQSVPKDASVPGPVLGIDDHVFVHQAGLITKMEVRAVVLACLQLEPGLVLWDIGAGSGSVAIEASRVARLHQVVAVEKDGERFSHLQQNIQQFGSGDLMAVHGAAPEVLRELADPHRVFLGGSGGNLSAILDEVARRLQLRGRVVQTAVSLDSLNEIISFWRGHGWQVSVSEVQVSRSVPIGNSVRLEALNPVFVVSSWAAGDPPA
jgi:precorrin-6B C5,15-methyltransferase / cobalt-precorrin-6B C5,C15-methyltransferase